MVQGTCALGQVVFQTSLRVNPEQIDLKFGVAPVLVLPSSESRWTPLSVPKLEKFRKNYFPPQGGKGRKGAWPQEQTP